MLFLIHKKILLKQLKQCKSNWLKSRYRQKKASRKEKTPKIVLAVTEPDIEPVCDGKRRSKRVKVQARANLKPIYEPENFVNFDGKILKMRKIVGFE